jgi:hypothetical protein
MRRLSLLCFFALLTTVAALAQPCSNALSSGPTFNASLLNAPSMDGGFAGVSLSLSGSSATINADTLGLNGDATSLSLFQGSPGSATLIMTFTDDANLFHSGSFTRTVALDPAVAAQIAANPSSFFFALDTPRGTITGPLATETAPVLTGSLNGPTGNGSFFLTLGTPNGNGDVPILFDVATTGLGNQISGLQLVSPTGDPILMLGSNLTTTNGHVTGTVLTNSVFAQQLLGNPCGVSLALSTPSGLSVAGALAIGREVFVPVAGSTPGLLGNRWKTDLNIFSSATNGNGLSALVQFIPTGGSPVSALSASTLSLPTRGTASTRDITNAMFQGINGIGAIRIISSGSIFANARVYDDQTANGKGTLGQSVPGLTRSQALRRGVLVGLTNIRGGVSGANAIGAQNARANIGFFNPNDSETTVAIELRDSNGSVIGTRLLTLGPLMHTQLPLAGANGLFTGNDSDFTGASVTFLSGAPLFAYASIVDNDSGDASYVAPSAEEQE